MIKTKKQMFIVIGLFTLVLLIGGVTYAWFTYRGETKESNLVAGDIYLTMTQGNETLTLTNVFPETKEEARAKDDNFITFSLDGLNTSNKTIYYEILLSHGDDKASPKSRYLDSELVFDLVELDANGNEVKYVVDAESYDTLSNTMIWVDTIDAETDENVSRKYKLRAWVSEDVIISDSEPNANYTTTEFPNKYATVKVAVNGDFRKKEMPKAYAMLKDSADKTTQINFANASSASNGEGLYLLKGTENYIYPIYYYRGAVNNNNVIFGGFCWQMVRTTDTGGIKMIYNGVVTGTSEAPTCENTTGDSRALSGNRQFNSQHETISGVGYMYNATYQYVPGSPASGAYFGTSVEYGEYDANNPGTSVYRLVNNGNGSIGTSLDYAHHYTCNATTPDATCSTIRYYHYGSYYINLTGGEKVEDALYKMTGTGDTATKTRNAGYVLNQNNSSAKTVLENWFKSNLTNELDSTKIDYTPYLEDTIFCNDRSFKTLAGWLSYSRSGWNPNGGYVGDTLGFGTQNRLTYVGTNNTVRWYSTTNVPQMTCVNETDRFSVSNSVAHLNYPVGLLTLDEIILAGAAGNSHVNNTSYYLATGNKYWTMTPASTGGNSTYVYDFTETGDFGTATPNCSFNLRPVLSLKPGIDFEKGGDGTPTNPYIVKYE